MDSFSLAIGITLGVLGLFLMRDFAGALIGLHVLRGSVRSVQQLTHSILKSADQPHYVAEGFYPIIEYPLDGKPVQFTAICQGVSGKFHVGDNVKLRFMKTRRSVNRWGKGVFALIGASAALGATMIYAAVSSGFALSISQIFLASVVLALALFALVMFLRGQDENCVSGLKEGQNGVSEICLSEPTAFNKWKEATIDRRTIKRLRSTQVCGITCMLSAIMLFLLALKPLLVFGALTL